MHEHGIPGQLIERPWVDFAHNRSESLALGTPHGDYLLVIDADEYLEIDPGFTMPALTADVYSFDLISGPHAYPKRQLLRAGAGWRYLGVLHEYAVTPGPFTEERMPGRLRTIRVMDGARSRDPMTYRRDALVLEEALLRDPGDSRTMFYLAQSYADAGEIDLAIDRYTKRIAMGGWDEEVWCSKYQIAKLLERKEEPWPEVQQAFLEAFALRPSRAEPLFRIGAHYQAQRDFALAHLFFSKANTLPYPSHEVLLVEHEVYRFLLPLEYAVACFYVGDHEQAIRTANRLLTGSALTPEQKDQVIRNRRYSLDALFPPTEPERSVAEPGVLVVLACMEGSVPTWECIDSLRSQTHKARTVLIETNNDKASHLHIDASDMNVTRKQAPRHATWAECLGIAAAEANAGDILVPLPPGAIFTDKRCIADLLHHFQRYGGTMMYGQFRWADGALGDAIPFASARELEQGDGIDPGFTLAFRRELLEEQPLPKDAQPLDLMRRAGYRRLRFTDRPLARYLDPGLPRK